MNNWEVKWTSVWDPTTQIFSGPRAASVQKFDALVEQAKEGKVDCIVMLDDEGNAVATWGT